MALEKTWRWFGINDPISLDNLVEIGVEGVVTALHHLKPGQVWLVEEIMQVKDLIESKGLRWSVVESLPVAEGIKIKSDDYSSLIKNYQESIRNLGACGIDTICYNFMPVLDWARTDLEYTLPDRSESMAFDFPTFVAFDVFILQRPKAINDYPKDLVQRAEAIFQSMSVEEAEKLAHNIMIASQNFINGPLAEANGNAKLMFLDFIGRYRDIDEGKYRNNLKEFLDNIIPVAEESGIRMAIHPDDPPFSILGLPRIMSKAEDYEWLLSANRSPNNGFTFCTGSLGSRKDNDLLKIIRKFKSHIHFVHLRNIRFTDERSFYESGHLSGYQDMPSIMAALLNEQRRRIKEGRTDVRLPFRPDHGLKLLDDHNHSYNPGYPLNGRLKGLAEIDGLMKGIEYHLDQNQWQLAGSLDKKA